MINTKIYVNNVYNNNNNCDIKVALKTRKIKNCQDKIFIGH